MAISTGVMLFGTTAAAITTTQLIIGGIVFAGASAVVSSVLIPKPSVPSMGSMGSSGSNLSAKSDPIGNAEIVYGEIRKAGNKVYHETTGNGRYYHFFVTLAMHEVEEIGDIYINDEIVTIDANGFVTSNGWQSKVFIKKFTGASNQDIYSDLSSVSNSPTQITSTFKGQGAAVLYVRLFYDANVFKSGIPLITATVKGKKLYDPRKDSTKSSYDSSLGVSTHRDNTPSTWQYSTNPALAIRDYLTSDLGVASSQDEIDDDMFAVAANDCATQSGAFNTGTNSWYNDITVEENSFEIGGSLSTGNSKMANINTLIKSLNGTLFWAQGKFRLVAGSYRNPEVSDAFTLDDVRSSISIQTRFSRRELVNTVRGTFVDKNNRYIAGDFPQLQLADMSEDNGIESVIDVDFPLTTKSSSAQRLAKQILYTSREQITLNAKFSAKAYQLQVGDRIKLTFDRYGWSNKIFLVKGWKAVSDASGTIEVELDLQETSSTAYQWSITQEEYAAITSNNSSLHDILDDLSPGNPTFSTSALLQSDGSVLSKVAASWTAAASGQVVGYDVHWLANSDSITSKMFTSTNTILISGLQAGETYTVNVYAVTSRGNRTSESNKGTATFSAASDGTAPSTPTFTASNTKSGGYKSASFNFTASPEDDVAGYEIYRNTSNAIPSDEKDRISSTSFTEGGLADNTVYYYWVRAYDYSGNVSSTSLSIGAITTLAELEAPIAPIYAALDYSDIFTTGLAANTYLAYATNMSGGAGDYAFLNVLGGTLDITSVNGSVKNTLAGSFMNGLIDPGNSPEYLLLQAPSEESNTTGDYASLDTMAYPFSITYKGSPGGTITFTNCSLFGKVTSNSRDYYWIDLGSQAGRATIPTASGTGVRFEINAQLRGERGSGRWNIQYETINAAAVVTGDNLSIKALGSTTQAVFNNIAGTTGVVYAVGDLMTSAITTASGSAQFYKRPLTSEISSIFRLEIGDEVDNDQAWFYAGSITAPDEQTVFIHDISTNAWSLQTEVIDGNLLVNGTVTASKIKISNPNNTSKVEILENKILIYNNNVVRVKIGDLGP